MANCGDAARHRLARMESFFIAFGDSGDVRQLIRIIRAFALASRLGDRLTIVGCAQKRRKLAKWVEALRIDGVTTLADVDDWEFWVRDPRAVIIFARLHSGREHLLLNALAQGVPIVALGFDDRSAEFARYATLINVPEADDVIGLCSTLLYLQRRDRHSVERGAPSASVRNNLVR